jgi:predicted DNA-binding transcriptional regulator YafY
MSRLNKAHDLIELTILLQNSYCGLTIEDIQNHFECSRRSAERMKTLLFELFPEKIEKVQTNEKKKHWRFVKGAANVLISFNADDFANLEYLKTISNDESRKEKLNELILKIKALTPQKKMRSLDTDISAILESEGFAVKQYSRVKYDQKTMEDIRNALLSFKKLRFDYPVEEEIFSITLNPYGIIIADKYYLVGYNEYVNDLRLYLVNEINNLEVLDEYFEPDEKFSLKDYSANSFGIFQESPLDIILEFDKEVANSVMNYHFHPTQDIKQLKNGNAQVKFTAGGTISICNELFKWGEYVKIKSPGVLKTTYKEKLERILKRI